MSILLWLTLTIIHKDTVHNNNNFTRILFYCKHQARSHSYFRERQNLMLTKTTIHVRNYYSNILLYMYIYTCKLKDHFIVHVCIIMQVCILLKGGEKTMLTLFNE